MATQRRTAAGSNSRDTAAAPEGGRELVAPRRGVDGGRVPSTLLTGTLRKFNVRGTRFQHLQKGMRERTTERGWGKGVRTTVVLAALEISNTTS